MKRFTYITTHANGKYYVGRHSTKSENDGYMGSGKWIKSVKDRDALSRVILEYFETEEELISAEQKLLDENVGQPNCMNFNNRASGFASGERNPYYYPEVKAKRESRPHWMQTEEGRKWASENNPSKRPDIKIKRREALYKNKKITDSWTLGENHHMKTEEHKERMRKDNPSFREEVKEKLSVSSKNLVASGVIPLTQPWVQEKSAAAIREKWESGELFYTEEHKKKLSDAAKKRERIECPHCGKVCSKPLAVKYHLDKCKHKKPGGVANEWPQRDRLFR